MAGPRPLNEQFSEQYGQRASIRPRVGGISGVRNVKVDLKNPHERRGGKKSGARTTAKASGTAMQTVGTAAQVAGKTAKVAGGVTMRAGAALSGTGIGAVAGVPLMVVGGVTRAGGTAVDVAGKMTRKAGSKTKRAVRSTKRRKGAAGKLKKGMIKLKTKGVSRASFTMIFYSWLTLQLPMALINVAFFGLTALFLSFKNVVTESNVVVSVVFDFFGKVAGALNEAINFLVGVDVFEFLSKAAPSNIYIVTLGIIIAYMLIMLMALSVMYLLAGFRPIFGNGAALKIVTLLLCPIGYIIPILNLFPWALLWVWAIAKNPK